MQAAGDTAGIEYMVWALKGSAINPVAVTSSAPLCHSDSKTAKICVGEGGVTPRAGLRAALPG